MEKARRTPPPMRLWQVILPPIVMPVAGLLMIWAGSVGRGDTPQVLAGVLFVVLGVVLFFVNLSRYRKQQGKS
ncbi:hypothetical protein AB5J62_22040 [Amycolatopsis sp. cg5]|uniref:hypothetical protein n=1 Tax=Amycolatopsis sp. cg5 TaxID=3238802 RepID=UPI0035242B67